MGCVRALMLSFWCHVGIGVSTTTGVAEPAGDKGQSSPCAGRSVPLWLGLCVHPLHGARCISTHHPGVHILPPTQTTVPGSQDHGAVGWLLATSSLPGRWHKGLDAVSLSEAGCEDRMGSWSCWSVLG